MSLKRFDNHVSSSQLLNHLISEAGMARAVRRLPSNVLGRVINRVGLEDAGELIMLATTSQLREVLDDDVWGSVAAGDTETFDERRFALWLEVMLQTGEDVLIDRLGGLPVELVVMAFSHMAFVLDLDEMAIRANVKGYEDMDLDEKALESARTFEFDQYTIISKDVVDFDVLITVLCALYSRDPDLFERVCEACCDASTAFIEEEGGLYNVLSMAEMLVEDATAERTDRRAEKGYVAPTDAKAFLALAKQQSVADLVENTGDDPVTRAYFREYSPGATAGSAGTRGETVQQAENDTLARILVDAGVETEAPPLLVGRTAAPRGDFRDTVSRVAAANGERLEALTSALSYLINLLVSAFSHAEYTVRPIEAAEAVMDICSIGMAAVREISGEGSAGTDDAILNRYGTVKLFQLGWSRVAKDAVVDTFLDVLRVLAGRFGTASRG